MAKNSKKNENNAASVSESDHASLYEVLPKASPVPLKNGRMASPGDKFRPIDVLCYPQQMDSLLKADPARVKPVKVVKK